MKPDEKILLKNLFTQTSVLSLSVLVEQLPYVGLLPFVATDRFGEAIVHASGLAKHSKGLQGGAPFSILIYQSGPSDLDPLQLPRVMLNGTVHLINKGSGAYENARELYLSKFPSAQQTFSLGDFNLHRLVFAGGRFVIGFGRTVNLKAETLTRLSEAGGSI